MAEEALMKSNRVNAQVSVNFNVDNLRDDDRRFRVVLVINGSIMGDEFCTTDALEALQKYQTWCNRWGIKPE
jgi:hypothetical protein